MGPTTALWCTLAGDLPNQTSAHRTTTHFVKHNWFAETRISIWWIIKRTPFGAGKPEFEVSLNGSRQMKHGTVRETPCHVLCVLISKPAQLLLSCAPIVTWRIFQASQFWAPHLQEAVCWCHLKSFAHAEWDSSNNFCKTLCSMTHNCNLLEQPTQLQASNGALAWKLTLFTKKWWECQFNCVQQLVHRLWRIQLAASQIGPAHVPSWLRF